MPHAAELAATGAFDTLFDRVAAGRVELTGGGHQPAEAELAALYPIIYVDVVGPLVVAVGLSADGVEHTLGAWTGAVDDVALWRRASRELRRRGLRETLIVCCEDVPLLAEALAATCGRGTERDRQARRRAE